MATVRRYLWWPNWTGLAQCPMAPVPATNCWLSLPMLPGVHPSPCRAKLDRADMCPQIKQGEEGNAIVSAAAFNIHDWLSTLKQSTSPIRAMRIAASCLIICCCRSNICRCETWAQKHRSSHLMSFGHDKEVKLLYFAPHRKFLYIKSIGIAIAQQANAIQQVWRLSLFWQLNSGRYCHNIEFNAVYATLSASS